MIQTDLMAPMFKIFEIFKHFQKQFLPKTAVKSYAMNDFFSM